MPYQCNDAWLRKVLIHFSELPSTHLYAIDFISKSNPNEVTCISTDFQTAGIGQHGSTWHAPKNQNLNLSIIFHPENFPINFLYLASMIVALSVYRALADCTQEQLAIKWPNDILLTGKKICGILLQSQFQSDKVTTFVMSFGVNISTSFDRTTFQGICLNEVARKKYTAEEVQKKILYFLKYYFTLNLKKRYINIVKEYHEKLFQIGIKSKYLSTKYGKIEGTILGVDTQGRLIVHSRGEVLYFRQKEIIFL